MWRGQELWLEKNKLLLGKCDLPTQGLTTQGQMPQGPTTQGQTTNGKKRDKGYTGTGSKNGTNGQNFVYTFFEIIHFIFHI